MAIVATKIYADTVAVLASMHGNERVIGPTLREGLGLVVEAAIGIDTDQFGSFSRETDRSGSQLDAAKAKIMAGFEKLPRARVGLASGGSFRPHPDIPFLGIGRELILMVDRKKGIELTGYNAGPQTNFAHAVVQDVDAAFALGQRAGFPEHGLIVMACHKILPAPHTMLDKNVTDAASLETAVKKALNLCGSAFVETDMRANRNPPAWLRSDARQRT